MGRGDIGRVRGDRRRHRPGGQPESNPGLRSGTPVFWDDGLQSLLGSLYSLLPEPCRAFFTIRPDRTILSLRFSGGSSSGVERHVANVVVVGSNPISRSIFCIPSWRLTLETRRVRGGGPSHPSRV